MSQYRQLFVDEARVSITALDELLRRLSAGCDGEAELIVGRRHSRAIKGMALYEQQTEIAVLAWAMERGFDRLAEPRVPATLVADLAAAVPVLARMVAEVEEHGTSLSDSSDLVAALEATT